MLRISLFFIGVFFYVLARGIYFSFGEVDASNVGTLFGNVWLITMALLAIAGVCLQYLTRFQILKRDLFSLAEGYFWFAGYFIGFYLIDG